MNWIYIILLIWNIIVCLLYGTDKLLAKAHKRRIREATLLICAFLIGSAGAMFGMVLFNHKTSKTKFRFLVPASVIMNIVIIISALNRLQ